VQMASGKAQRLSIVVILILAFLLYNVFLMQLFGRRARIILVVVAASISLIFLLTGSSFRIYLIFIISLPLTATFVIDIGFTIKPSFILLLLLIFVMLASREIWYSRSPLDNAVLIFLGVCALSITQTIIYPPPYIEFVGAMRYRGTWFRSIIQLALLCFFTLSYFFTVHICGNDRKRLNTTLKVYIVVAIIVSSYGIYQAFATHFDLPLKNVTNAMKTGGMGHGGVFADVPFRDYRSQSTFGEPLGFGEYILSVLPFLMAFGSVTGYYIDLERRSWGTKISLSLIICLLFIAMFMSRSRGPLAGFTASIFVMIILLRHRHLPRFISCFIIPLIILSVFYSLGTKFLGLSGDILEVLRFRTFFIGAEETEGIGDLLIAKGGPKTYAYFHLTPMMFVKHPVLGVGIGNSPLHLAAILGVRTVIPILYGLWCNILVETGVLGFAAFLWLVFTYYRVMIRTLRRVRGTHWAPYIIGYMASFTGLVVTLQFHGDIKIGMYIWFFLGLSMATVRIIDSELQQILTQNSQQVRTE